MPRLRTVTYCMAVVLLLVMVGPAGAVDSPPAPQVRAAPIAWGDPHRVEDLAAAARAAEPALAKIVAEVKAPGMALGLVADGKLVWFKGWGVRDIATGAAVDEHTVFRIASLAKAFVSAAVLRLRDEGKLSLDDPAERYLPELRGLRYPTADSPRITVRHLLSHASGLPEDNASADLRLAMPDAEFAKWLGAGLSFSSAPGTHHEYSNLAFVLAGRIVARKSGMRVQEYVTRHLLLPLGMTSTYWDVREVPAERRAHGYDRASSGAGSSATIPEGELHEQAVLNDGAYGPSGGLWTSAHDYARWVAFHLSAWPPRDDPDTGPVRRASLREAHQLQRPMPLEIDRYTAAFIEGPASGYGLGWYAGSSCRFDHVVRHGGGLPGWGSLVWFFPEEGVGVVGMSNLTYFGGTRLARELLGALDAKGLLPRRPPAPAPAIERARDTIAGLLRSWDQDKAASSFDSNILESLPPTQARFEELRRAHGACRSTRRIDPENALRGQVRLACDRGEISLRIELTPDLPPRIQALRMESIMPPPERLVRAASSVMALMARWDDDTAAKLFAPDVDRVGLQRQLARAATRHGTCSVYDALKADGKDTATFKLACDRDEVELGLTAVAGTERLQRLALMSAQGGRRCPSLNLAAP